MNEADIKALHRAVISENLDDDVSISAYAKGWQAALEWRGQGEPVFWYRPVGTDGGYEGPIHNWAIEEVRKKSGAWVPLYPTPPTAQINEQMREALEAAKEFIYSAQYVAAVQKIEAALAAANAPART